MHVLVVNAGSSSLKLHLLDSRDQVLATHELQDWAGADETEQLREFVTGLERIDAVGHRIVHGGTTFRTPTVIRDQVRDRLAGLADLAPLHQPRGVAGIDALTTILPDPPAVACFDTTFHTTLPQAAATYALPREWNERWGLRRYGFHGLSHAYAARRAAEMLNRPLAALRIVTCHLGAGASLAAVRGGQSVDTTMGFTPLAGLVMATRTGSLDPGLIVWLQQHGGLDLNELSDALEHRSGLAGLAGGSGDMREIEQARRDGDPRATLAFDVYTHRLRREIAAMTAALGGLDALVFTGGVGEHSAQVRAACQLHHLGIDIDDDRNQHAHGDTEITGPDAPTRSLVVTAREELEIAHATRTALA